MIITNTLLSKFQFALVFVLVGILGIHTANASPLTDPYAANYAMDEILCDAPIVTTTNLEICSGSTATLTPLSSEVGTVFSYYDAATGGTLLGTGSTFITPALTANTTYYVIGTIDTCASTVVAVEVIVNDIPDITAMGTTICSASTVVLSASSSTTGAVFEWFLEDYSVTPVFTGASYVTPVISTTTTYYVQAVNGTCSSARIPVVVAYSASPIAVVATASRVCISGTSTLSAGSAISGATFNWYDAPGGTLIGTGATITSPSLTTTTSFYVIATISDCESAPFEVSAIVVNPTIIAPPVVVCYGDTAFLAASSIPSGAIRWYADETSTTVLHTGLTYTIPLATTSATYYVTATVHGCTSARVPVTLMVTPEIDITTADAGICTIGSVTLTASSTTAGATINWYNVPTGGAPIGTGDTYETGTLSGPMTYYVEASLGGCTSERLIINVMAGSAPVVTASGSSICISGMANLTASSTTIDAAFDWYDAPTGGTSIFTGDVFTTPVLTATTIYYVEASAAGCTSTRIPVIVNVVSPTVAITNDTVCIAGTAMLIATPGASGTIVRWYNTPTGPHMSSGTTYVTPYLTTTTTYYVTATIGGCITERTPVTVVVNEIPTLDIIEDDLCISGIGTLSVSTSDYIDIEYRWYNTAAGGTLLHTGATYSTGTLSATTTYFIEPFVEGCTFPRVPARVIVNNPIAVAPNQFNCGPGSMTFNAIGSAGAIFKWYATLTSTSPLFTGASYTTPIISATTTYYVTATIGGCEGIRIPVIAEIRTIPIVTGIGTSICGPGTADITASSTLAGTIFEWYATSTGGSPLGGGAVFTTPSVSVTTTFYVMGINNGCRSERIAVVVTVNPVPTVTATSTQVCISGTSTLTATSTITGATISWYSSMMSTSPLGTGASYTTGTLTASTTLFVQASIGGCNSVRIPVPIIVVNPIVNVANQTICDTMSVTLVASSGTGSLIQWYATATGGTPIATGGTFITPDLTATTTYYVSSTISGCTSARVPNTVTVNTYEYTIIPSRVCELGTVTLYAAIDDIDAIIEWYDDDLMTTLLSIGSTFTTPVLTTTTIYYFRAVTAECVTNLRPITASVNPLPALTVTPTMALVCPGDSVTFTALMDPDYTYLWSNGVTTNEMTTNVYGNHMVTVIDENTCQSSMTVFLDTIVSPTIAGFDFVPNIFSNPYMYNFTPIDAVGATGYYWTFGDGGTSDEFSPNHEYSAFGTYNVVLNIFNECDSATISLEIFVKPAATNGIDDFEDEGALEVYPNPTTSELNIALKNADKISNVKVFNLLGQMMKNENVDNKAQHLLNVAQLASGSYYLVIATHDGKTAIRKFVVQ